MISINRYICVAAAAVFGSQAMELQPLAPGTQLAGNGDGTPTKAQNKEWNKKVEANKHVDPSEDEIGAVQHAASTFSQETFGNFFAKPKNGTWWNGEGFALKGPERRFVSSVIAIAQAVVDPRKKFESENSDLFNACDWVIKNKRTPNDWDKSQGFFNSHCRLTGKVFAQPLKYWSTSPKISTATGVKLSPEAEKKVLIILNHFEVTSPKEVFDILVILDHFDEKVTLERRYALLQALLAVDTRCESELARLLTQQLLQAEDSRQVASQKERDGAGAVDYRHLQRFQDATFQSFVQNHLSKTPFFHLLVNTKFKELECERSVAREDDVVQTWPGSILVFETQVGIDSAVARYYDQVINNPKTKAWTRSCFRKVKSMFDRSRSRKYVLFNIGKIETGTANYAFTFAHEATGVARHMQAPQYFNGSTEKYFHREHRVAVQDATSFVQTFGWTKSLTREQKDFAKEVAIAAVVIAATLAVGVTTGPVGWIACLAVLAVIATALHQFEKDDRQTAEAALATATENLAVRTRELATAQAELTVLRTEQTELASVQRQLEQLATDGKIRLQRAARSASSGHGAQRITGITVIAV
jgi:hypothetical protein